MKNGEDKQMEFETKTLISEKESAVKELIQRLLPEHSELFDIKIVEKSDGEFFTIGDGNDKIVLKGTSPVTIAAALNWYLKYYTKSHLSWSGNRINLLESLQKVNVELTLRSYFEYRYYLNYCTFSYSMPWWNWDRWEREIDFMALNGINLALALTGQEAVWQELFNKYGCSTDELTRFLAGPAFLAWGWLNNLDGWGGPTTQNWIDDQKDLQMKILERMRSLQITPVLQAFTGRIPKCFKDIFPNAKITKLPGWYDYEGVYFLDPDDPLFEELGRSFYKIQSELYGNGHYYAGDIFHEIDSSDKTNTYMSGVYKRIQENLLEADPAAKWILQSWTIRDDSISILDSEHTAVLDMFCESEPKWEKTNHFHGLPWLWSIITNFGGRSGLGAPIQKIVNDLHSAKTNIPKEKMIGLGYVPEGIENNNIIFDLLWEMNWRNERIDVKEWVKEYVLRRYGSASDNIVKAWHKLLDTVYSGPEGYSPIESVISAEPSLNVKSVSSNGFTAMYYNNGDLLEAFELLHSDASLINGSEPYKYDLIDIARQVGANLGNSLYDNIVEKFKQKDLDGFCQYYKLFLELAEDLDDLLGSNKYFTLGFWLENAKLKAKDKSDLKLYEWNARRQITLWSSPEITEFHDYANKQWNGLIRDYYIPRWKFFFEVCIACIEKGIDLDQKEIKKNFMNMAVEWSDRTDKYLIQNNEDVVIKTKDFIEKYKKHIIKI